jgi:phosphatidylglycerophosphate synthase
MEKSIGAAASAACPAADTGIARMIDGYARNLLPGLTGGLISFYRRLGVTPNQLTVLGCAIALVAALLVSAGHAWSAVVVWWLGRLVDGTDGILARATGRVSAFGGYLDITLDMAAYSVMVLGFYFWQPQFAPLWMITLILYILAITSALSLGALERARGVDGDNRSLKLAAGLAEGGETGISYTLMLLLPQFISVLLPLWILVLAATFAARTVLAWRLLGRSQ